MTYSAQLASFLVRPKLIDGESLSSWCWRIYLANGFVVPPHIRLAVKAIRADQNLGVHHHVLVGLFGLEKVNALQAREYGVIERWNSSFRPSWYEWAATPRFCPLCVAEIQCHQLTWDLPLVTACAVHGCQLMERCHVCRRKPTWATLLPDWHCLCGAKIAKASVQPAPKAALRLAKILSAASDAQVPLAVGQASGSKELDDLAYRTRDVYETLWWLMEMRTVLTSSPDYFFARRWPSMYGRRGAKAPGLREISLLSRIPTIGIKVRHILRWSFRYNHGVLVDLADLPGWLRTKQMLDNLRESRNPLGLLILHASSSVQGEHVAGIPGQSETLFNPRLNMAERCTRIEELSSWWRRLSVDISNLGSSEKLDPRRKSFGYFYEWDRLGPSATNAILNVFFDAAHSKVSPGAFNLLTLRWHIPKRLRALKDVLPELGCYLSTLHRAEQLFVLALAGSALSNGLASQAGSPTRCMA